MKRLVTLALLTCGVLYPQKIFVSPFADTGMPASCTVAPYSFKIPFTFYVDTYDCNGTFSYESTFAMTGTGYCSGLGFFCNPGTPFQLLIPSL